METRGKQKTALHSSTFRGGNDAGNIQKKPQTKTKIYLEEATA